MAFSNGHRYVPCGFEPLSCGLRAVGTRASYCACSKSVLLFVLCGCFLGFLFGVLFFFYKVKISSKCPHMRADAIMHVETRN